MGQRPLLSSKSRKVWSGVPARRVVAPDIQAGGNEQAVQLVEAMPHRRRDAFAASRDNGVPPLGEGAGDDRRLHAPHNRLHHYKRHPRQLQDFQHVPLVGPDEGAERDVLQQMGRQPHGCPLVAHRGQAAQEPLGVRQLPPAGVRRRGRRAAQHLMAEANEGAEVDGWNLDQTASGIMVHKLRLLESRRHRKSGPGRGQAEERAGRRPRAVAIAALGKPDRGLAASPAGSKWTTGRGPACCPGPSRRRCP